MPRQTNRREVLADAILRVLVKVGAHGLTHRAIDAEAGVPVGTTSRYFRTRAALLLAAAQTVRDRHHEYMERLAASKPASNGNLSAALTDMITDAQQTNRDLYVARIELSLESLRSPELRPILEDVRTSSIQTAQQLAHNVGISLTERQIDLVGSLLLGTMLDAFTLERPHLAADRAAETLTHVLTVMTEQPQDAIPPITDPLRTRKSELPGRARV